MNRAQEILQTVDEFLEEYRVITLDKWNEIVLGIQEKSVREGLKELEGVAVEVDKIADIRNALTIIQLNCQQVPGNWMSKDRVKMTKTVIEQVERIDKLLPVIKFEREK